MTGQINLRSLTCKAWYAEQLCRNDSFSEQIFSALLGLQETEVFSKSHEGNGLVSSESITSGARASAEQEAASAGLSCGPANRRHLSSLPSSLVSTRLEHLCADDSRTCPRTCPG